MGAGQTYQWAVSYPDMVARACPFCGSSKTSERNIVFLELSSSSQLEYHDPAEKERVIKPVRADFFRSK